MAGQQRPSDRGFFNNLFSRPKYVTVHPRRVNSQAPPSGAGEAEPARTQSPLPGTPTGLETPAPVRLPLTPAREVPDGLWVKCGACGQILYTKDLAKNLYVCYRCQAHLHIPARDRCQQLLDHGLEEEFAAELTGSDPLQFPGYREKLEQAQEKTGLREAALIGRGHLDGLPVALGVLDFSFMGGSMGWAVGEKISCLFDRARELRLPVILFSAGGGGARMQEGVVSLMQMATTTQAVARFSQAGLLYISVLTDPTMGGVYASFASLGDILLAEPGARIGFTGPRVIEQTIRQKLPPGFQTAEFVLKNGMIDAIVDRREMKETLARLLRFHMPAQRGDQVVQGSV